MATRRRHGPTPALTIRFRGQVLFWITSLALAHASVSSSRAATIRVPKDSPSIAAALASAASEDTVLVACGVYVEHDLEMVSGVLLRGEGDSPDCVTIDAQGLGRILLCERTQAGTAVEGITFKRGFTRGVSYGRAQPNGAIAPEEGPSERDLLVAQDDDAFIEGIHSATLRSESVPVMTGEGGSAAACFSSVVAFRNCAFQLNESSSPGGAIRAVSSSVTITDCTFADNVSKTMGGAVSLENCANPGLLRCTFHENRSRVGGAISFFGGTTSRVEGSTFFANRAAAWAPRTGGTGGAILAVSSEIDVIECTFAANVSVVRASGIQLGGSSSAHFERTVIAFGVVGAAVAATGTATATIECSDVFGNGGGDYDFAIATMNDQYGNIQRNPRFCSLDQGDLRVAVNSPCLPQFSPCGERIGALDSGECLSPDLVLITTVPTGLSIEIDGDSVKAPTIRTWTKGTTHTLGTSSQQPSGPGRRSNFAAWSDGGAIFHSLVHDPAVEVYIANFENDFFVTMSAGPGGTVAPQTGWFKEFSFLEMFATPANTDYAFNQWTGVGLGSYTGTNNPATVQVRAPISEIATFSYIGLYTLSIFPSPATGGTTSPPAGTFPYPAGSAVPITATPAPHFEFGGWTAQGNGSYGGYQSSVVIHMNGNILQVANFFPRQYPLTMHAGAHGSVTPTTGNWAALSSVPITAIPAPGYVFQGWTGTGPGSYTGTNNPAIVTMLGAITESAQFALGSFPLTMAVSGQGTVSPQSGVYTGETVVPITATASPGWEFTGWSGTGPGSYTGPNNPATVTVLGPINETAHFQPLSTVTFSTIPPGQQLLIDGMAQVTPATFSWYLGSVHTIAVDSSTVTPGWEFTDWIGTGPGSYTGPNNPATVTVLGSASETAHFQPLNRATFLTIPPGQTLLIDGMSHVTPAEFSWYMGSVHTIAADSSIAIDAGVRYEFIDWSDGLPRSHSYIMPATPDTVTASFALQYLLTVQPVLGGTTSPLTSWHAPGSSITLTAHASPSFVFASWTGVGPGSYTGTQNPTIVTLPGPITQTAHFSPFGYNFSISASATDPFVNVDTSTGDLRSVHLWLTCAPSGLAAFQGSVVGSLSPLAFNPANGVFNIGSASDLLLAIGGCPTGTEFAARLGEWIVNDVGGDLCIATHSEATPYVAVDCDSIIPSVAVDSRIIGFSSTGSLPCLIDASPCETSGPPPSIDLSRMDPGKEATTVSTPLVDAFEGIIPNPFAGTTEIRFSSSATQRATVGIYDVTGRRVRRLAEGDLPAGSHRLLWDGQNDSGDTLPAGVYFVKLSSGPLERTQRIVSLGRK